MDSNRPSGKGPIEDLIFVDINAVPVDGALPFEISGSTSQRAAMAEALGVPAVRKLRASGEILRPTPGTVIVSGEVGATVEQTCVVTLEPVTTRIDEPIRRTFSANVTDVEDDYQIREDEDVNVDPLGDAVDLAAVVAETLALALPPYPRADGASLDATQFAAPGVTPMTDEAARPFAALEALKEKLSGKQ